MGKRGPAPKPTALKILEGNPGKQKLNANEPKPRPLDAIPRPPTRLLPDAKKEWKRLAPTMVATGLLTDLDLSAFAELCQNYAYYLSLDKQILALGEDKGPAMLQRTPSGYYMTHPLLSLRRNYYENWRRGLADFGLTPSSRSRIIVGDSGGNGSNVKNGGGKDDMEDLLSGGW